jgi:RNA polymerase sigma-70 factor (ECF subfamily)
MAIEMDTLRGIRDEDRLDWNAVYAAELPRVYNYFRYRIGDDDVAEDLTAATFEKAWRKRKRYRRDLGAFTTWLFTIARNTATDYFRCRRERVSLEAVEPLLCSAVSVEGSYRRRQDLARLARLLEGLSEREQELVAMKYGAELTNRKIAELTGLSETNVGTILYRVVRKLRAQWEEEG